MTSDYPHIQKSLDTITPISADLVRSQICDCARDLLIGADRPTQSSTTPSDLAYGIVEIEQALGRPPQVVFGIHAEPFMALSPIPVVV